MRILLVGDCVADYTAKFHEALRTGLRRTFDMRCFGRGYPGFDPALTTYRQILAHACPDGPPDLLFVNYRLGPRLEDLTFYHEGLEEIDLPKVVVLSDFWNITEHFKDDFPAWLERHGIARVLCYYPRPVREYAGTRVADRFAFLPPCVDPEIFNDWREPRRWDVGFLGEGAATPHPFYPERAAIHAALSRLRHLRYLTAPRPSYDAPAGHPLIGQNFSRTINACRLFVTTGSPYRNPFGKYVEALASRTVLLAVEPEGAAALHLEDGVNYVSITPEDVADKVEYFLAHPERCEEIAEAGYRTAMRWHTAYARALDFHAAVADLLPAPRTRAVAAAPVAPAPEPAETDEGWLRDRVALAREALGRGDTVAAEAILAECAARCPGLPAIEEALAHLRAPAAPSVPAAVEIAAPAPPAAPAPAPRPRVLLIADVPSWIFERHARTLTRLLGDEFDFTTIFRDEPYDESAFDLVYPLEWNLVAPQWIRDPRKYVTGIRSHSSWAEVPFPALVEYLSTRYARVHVVSRRLLERFAPALPGVTYVTHGVDTELFTPRTTAARSGRRLRLGWAGNRQTPAKGFVELVEPLGRLPGVELVVCGYADDNLDQAAMPAFFDSVDAVVLASATEGNNNTLLEAASMARAIVTTDTGTVSEYLAHGHSALIVPREGPAIARAVETLRDDPERRARLGAAAREAVRQGWDWRQKAEDYRRMFREVLGRTGGRAKTHTGGGADRQPDAGPVLSVVITTLDRRDLLDRCLAGFAAQTLAREAFEVIVVDDGSREPAEDVAAAYRDRLAITYLYQDNQGLAAARNAGIAAARGTIIVPYDDDNAPHPDCLAEHARFHETHPEAADAMLAGQEWLPGLDVTPVMHYLTEIDSRLWCYKGLTPNQLLPFGFLWGGCSSYKKALVDAAGGFDPAFAFGYEDTEAEVRMRRVGLRVHYRPAARNFACRPVTYEAFCRRSERQGRSLWRFRTRYPDDAQVQAYTETPGTPELLARSAGLVQKIDAVMPEMLAAGWSLPAEGKGAAPSLRLLYRSLGLAFDYWKLKGFLEAQAERPEIVPARPGAAATPAGAARVPEPIAPAPAAAPLNVLVVAPELPLWDRSSGSFRLLQIVTLMRESGHEVTFVARNGANGHPSAPYVERLQALGVTVIPVDPERLAERFGIGVSGPRLDLPGLITGQHWDVAYLYFYELAHQYIVPIRHDSPATRVIVDSVDVQFLREERQAALIKDPEMIRGAVLTRRTELDVYRHADVVVAVTDADRRALLEADPGLTVEVLPNVHPVPPPPAPAAGRRDFLFVGGFGHRPNADGVLWFHREIWPRIAARLPGARFVVVGSEPPLAIQALAGDRVVVAGHVPSLAPYLAGCRASVAPLRYGAGMKGKVGEAMVAGLPVVGTSMATEGMGVEPGRHVLVADDPAAFAEACVRVYQDDALWARLSAEGRRFIVDRYAPDAVAARLERLLRGEAEARPRPVAIDEPALARL